MNPTDTQTNDGGPYHARAGDEFNPSQEGASLRDEFAKAVDMSIYSPNELLRREIGRIPNMLELAEFIARIRYLEADAMLRVRALPTPPKEVQA